MIPPAVSFAVRHRQRNSATNRSKLLAIPLLATLSTFSLLLFHCDPPLLAAQELSAQEPSAETQTAETQTAERLTAENEILFVRRIAPLLTEKCLACHGADQDEVQAGLNLSNAHQAFQAGDSGESSIVRFQAQHSPLYLAATRTDSLWSAMPPKDSEALTAQQLAWLKDWIDGGAAWPDKARAAEIEAQFHDQWSTDDGVLVPTSGGLAESWTNRRYDPAGLWAYKPVVKPNIILDFTADITVDTASQRSSSIAATQSQHPIDLLLALHRPSELRVAPPESRSRLMRRASFDLTGLPPSIEQVQAFVLDPRDDETAFCDVIDRLLASPHYGERMAQHWLDVVRYADSSGFANDYDRGNAWRYRDYVIRSFNDDKPYNLFVLEQLAGDELNPNDPEALIATGMLRMGPWELTSMEVPKVARQRFLDDVTNSVGETFLAHSLQCARCHDHKFDPVPTRDYYAIQSVFATTQLAERPAPFTNSENTQNFDQQDYLLRRKSDYESTLQQLEQVLLLNAQTWYRDHGLDATPWNEALKLAGRQGKTGSVFNFARNHLKATGVPESDYPPKLVGFTPEQFGLERVARKGLERLRWQLERYQPFALAVYNGRTPQFTTVSAPLRIPANAQTEGELEQICILAGGDPFSPTEQVRPAGLSALNQQIDIQFPEGLSGRRTALAEWITHPDNPLTSRTIVNRVWMWHFGRAIAGNPNNFGSTGKRPTHPELLDWLASTFVEQAWSFKQLHSTIMLSQAYRQSSIHSDQRALLLLDPNGDSYSVFQPRRLSAEELRDAMLFVTGELNPTLGGIPCKPEMNEEVALQPRQVMGTFAAAWTPDPRPADRHRRSIYALRLRGVTDPTFDVFNAPSPDFSCEQRSASTVTPQVFSLFNSQASYDRALSLAIDLLNTTGTENEGPLDREAILKHCFLRLYAREAGQEELQWCLAHWKATETALTEQEVQVVRQPRRLPTEILRNAVEENTGERFSFVEQLYENLDFVPDHHPETVNRTTVALSDLCLLLLNANEFVYID